MAALFISHASGDSSVSEQVRAALERAGYAALFLDIHPRDGIPGGSDWERELYAQLRKADAVVFLASPASVDSQWCHSELTLARFLRLPIFPVTITYTARHPILVDLQAIDATGDLSAGVANLCDDLVRARLDPGDSFAWDPNRPAYPGLRGFDAADAAVFFGRDSEISNLQEALRPTVQRERGRFIAVVGPSGSGKSSLVRAGLVPRLRQQRHRWLVLPPMLPGSTPLKGLARSVATPAGGSNERHPLEPAVTERGIAAGSSALIDLLHERCRQAEGSPSRVLLIVDQAEELLTRCGPDERSRFLDLLLGALDPNSPLEVVATVRSEFLSRLITDAGIADVIDTPLVIGPLPRSRLPEVITGPAQRAGLRLQAGLVERIVEDTHGGDALPLLAFTLERLAQRAGPDGELTHEDYDAVGGVIGALTTQAEATTARVAVDGVGASVLPTLLRLVTVDANSEPSERRRPLDEFDGESEAVIEAFVDARLLTTGEHEGTTTVAVAHEALLRQWPPLRKHIESSREALELRADIERSAREWDANDREESYLLRGARLAAAEETPPEDLQHHDEVESDYLAASRSLARREIEQARASNRRLRRLVAALITFALLATGGIAVAVRQTRVAEDQAALAVTQTSIAQHEAAVARSRQLAAQAMNLVDEDRYTGTLVALEAARSTMTREALAALQATLTRPVHASLGEPITDEDGSVRAVAFSPDGTTLASANVYGTVRLSDTATRQSVGEPITGRDGNLFPIPRSGALAAAGALAFSPDGTLLASAGSDESVRLWDTATLEPAGEPISSQSIQVWAVAFSPDSTLLASAGEDGTVRVWNTETREPVGEPITGHNGRVLAVAFSPDDSTLASAGEDGTVRLWDIATLQPVGEPIFADLFNWVWAVAFSPDGTRLASASDDGTVRLWDTTTHQSIGAPITGHDESVLAVAYSPDGTTLASASLDGTVRLWDTATHRSIGEPITGHNGSVLGMAFSPDGTTLASAGEDGNVHLWDTETRWSVGEPITGGDTSVFAVAFRPDGTTLASAGSAGLRGTVRLWDTDTRQPIGEPITSLPLGWVSAVAFSPDGATLASASSDGTVRLWETATRQPVGEPITGHDETVNTVAYSPDGTTLASASDDGTVRLWDTATRQPVGEPITSHDGPVRGVVFSPDGTTLASASDDGTVRLWDTATRQPVGEPITSHDGPVRGVAYSPDGTTLASASDDGTVRLWDTATRQPVGEPITSHDGPVRGVAYSPDGTTLASASDDGTVRLWDTATRQPVGEPITSHDGSVGAVAFSPDGTTLASASSPDGVRLSTTPASWVQAACGLVNRNLSQEQWRTWIGPDHPYVRHCADAPSGSGAPPDAPVARYPPPLSAPQ